MLLTVGPQKSEIRVLAQVGKGSFLTISSRGWKAKEVCRVSFIRARISLMRAPPSWPVHLLKAPPSNTLMLSIRTPTCEYGEDTNIQNIVGGLIYTFLDAETWHVGLSLPFTLAALSCAGGSLDEWAQAIPSRTDAAGSIFGLVQRHCWGRCLKNPLFIELSMKDLILLLKELLGLPQFYTVASWLSDQVSLQVLECTE